MRKFYVIPRIHRALHEQGTMVRKKRVNIPKRKTPWTSRDETCSSGFFRAEFTISIDVRLFEPAWILLLKGVAGLLGF